MVTPVLAQASFRPQLLVTATWDDAPHLTKEQKDELWASIPPYQRDARAKGVPVASCNVGWCGPGDMGHWKISSLYDGTFFVGHPSMALDPRIHEPLENAPPVGLQRQSLLIPRADDVIVRGGENFSPGEIEDVLLEHGAVADAAVAGVPSEQWGEAVIAAVVLKGEVTGEELQDWVKEHLRSSRVPERIEFWDELPYNETGKLLRRLVKARFL